jgi:hypothetical protein
MDMRKITFERLTAARRRLFHKEFLREAVYEKGGDKSSDTKKANATVQNTGAPI